MRNKKTNYANETTKEQKMDEKQGTTQYKLQNRYSKARGVDASNSFVNIATLFKMADVSNIPF